MRVVWCLSYNNELKQRSKLSAISYFNSSELNSVVSLVDLMILMILPALVEFALQNESLNCSLF